MLIDNKAVFLDIQIHASGGLVFLENGGLFTLNFYLVGDKAFKGGYGCLKGFRLPIEEA
jgi:hypothetical protein